MLFEDLKKISVLIYMELLKPVQVPELRKLKVHISNNTGYLFKYPKI